jgi:phospho-N-acetylmuramoyl-pentapeptide-transferase
MLSYISDFEVYFGPLRLFQYITFRAGGAFFTAIFLSLILGPWTISLLKRFQTIAPSRLKGLVSEQYLDARKEHVPSMGGLLLVFAIFISTIMWASPKNGMLWIFLGTLLLLGAVGFMDDYVKVALKKRDGVSGKLKIILQIIIAGFAVYLLDILPETGDLVRKFYIPFLKHPLFSNMPLAIGVGFGALVVVSSCNAVNLTDGKDGLAVGASIFCSLAYAIFAYVCGHKIFSEHLNVPFISGASEVVIFAMAISGACIGFLWFNCHPASMFMGDTGSLALGGSIGLMAVLVKQEVTLLVVGGVFVIETLSVIIQVTSFKLTGKRVFFCSPLHHHFERKGWTETQIVVRFWILAGMFAIIGIAALKIR